MAGLHLLYLYRRLRHHPRPLGVSGGVHPLDRHPAPANDTSAVTRGSPRPKARAAMPDTWNDSAQSMAPSSLARARVGIEVATRASTGRRVRRGARRRPAQRSRWRSGPRPRGGASSIDLMTGRFPRHRATGPLSQSRGVSGTRGPELIQPPYCLSPVTRRQRRPGSTVKPGGRRRGGGHETSLARRTHIRRTVL